MFERINIAVRRKGGGELVTAGSLFTILLSRAHYSMEAAVEEEQHDDDLLREEQLPHKERSCSSTRRGARNRAPPPWGPRAPAGVALYQRWDPVSH